MWMSDRPVRADARENRAKVLAAARSAFEAAGPDASLREIARRAGVAQGTVHRHFPTKEALFSAIITDRFRELTRLARRLSAERNAGEAFFAFIEATVEQARHNKSLASIFQDADGSEEMRAAGQEMGAELDRLLREAQASGAVRDDIDLADLHAIASAVLAMDAHPAAGSKDRAKRVAIVLDGLRAARS
jgi:AcrR family transcriptional regulator